MKAALYLAIATSNICKYYLYLEAVAICSSLTTRK
jgi:hypothetical protein